MATNPGFKARVTKYGLEYANEVALEVLSKKVVGCIIPDLDGESGDVKYEIKSLNVTEFVKPDSTITLDQSNGLVWKASGSNISGHGKWKYKLRHRWLKVSDSGKFDIRIRNLCFSVNIELGVDQSGRPTICSKSCSCDIDKVDVTFHGGASKIYNLFKGHLGHKLKHAFMDKMCDVVRNVINKDAAKSLGKLQVMVEMDKVFMLDYRLVSSPIFTSSYIETHHKGEVFWKGSMTEAPLQAQTLPDLEDEQKMLYFWTSSYLFNTFLYQAHTNGLMKYIINSDSLPEKCKDALKTTSTQGLFIGMFIPQIGMKYPDSELELHVSSKDPPCLNIQNGYVEMDCDGEIEIHVTLPNKTSKYVLSMDGALNVSMNISVQEQTIVGRIGNLSIKTKVTDSKIGLVSDEALQFLVDYALRVYIEPMLNEKMAKGFPLPVSENISFENPQLITRKDMLIVATDIIYSIDNDHQ